MTGKTVEEAKEAALYQLGVAEGDAELIVISEPKSGLFGRVRGEARVRARVRPVGPRPKRQRHGNRDRDTVVGRRPRRTPGCGPGGQSGKPATAGGPRARQPRTRPARHRVAARAARPVGGGAARFEGGAGGAAVGSRVNGSARSRDEDGSGDGRQGRGRGGPEGQKAKEEAEMAEGMTLEEQGEVAKEFLEGLLESYGFEGTVETRVDRRGDGGGGGRR